MHVLNPISNSVAPLTTSEVQKGDGTHTVLPTSTSSQTVVFPCFLRSQKATGLFGHHEEKDLLCHCSLQGGIECSHINVHLLYFLV